MSRVHYIDVQQIKGGHIATLFIHGVEILSVETIDAKEDKAPEKTAVARLYHELMKQIGENICYRPLP